MTQGNPPTQAAALAAAKSLTRDLAEALAPAASLRDLGLTQEECSDKDLRYTTWHTRLDTGRKVSADDLDRADDFLRGRGFEESHRNELGIGPVRQWVNKETDQQLYMVVRKGTTEIDLRPDSACAEVGSDD